MITQNSHVMSWGRNQPHDYSQETWGYKQGCPMLPRCVPKVKTEWIKSLEKPDLKAAAALPRRKCNLLCLATIVQRCLSFIVHGVCDTRVGLSAYWNWWLTIGTLPHMDTTARSLWYLSPLFRMRTAKQITCHQLFVVLTRTTIYNLWRNCVDQTSGSLLQSTSFFGVLVSSTLKDISILTSDKPLPTIIYHRI